MIPRAAALLFMFAAAVTFAQDKPKLATKTDVIEAVIKEGRENSKVMDHLKHLTKKIGPRLTGSDNLTKCGEWAKALFEEWGLKVELDEWGTYPVAYNRKSWSCKMTKPEAKDLVLGFHAWTAGTNGPTKGRAILGPTSADALAALKGKLKGAWIFSTGVATKGDLATAIRAAYDEEGIAGTIRSSGGDLIVTGGSVPSSVERAAKRPAAMMPDKQFKEIVALLKDEKEVEIEIDIKVEFRQGPIKLYNVVADIKGTEKPDEYVIVSGHMDSWDGAEGCTDNGTGTVTTLEAARLLMKAGAKPKRTIRFILWSGEEQGLLGSVSYVARHVDLLPKISAVLVHDGGTNYVSGIAATEALKPIFDKVFEPIIALNPDLPFKVSTKGGPLPLGIGSDHDTFLQAGVPGFFWQQSRTKDKGQNYNHEHHTQYDTYDAAVPEFEQHTAMVAAIAAWQIANLDELLPREGILPKGRKPVIPKVQSNRKFGINLNNGTGIASVEPDSPAERAGMIAGDEILSVDGMKVTNQSELNDAKIKAKKSCKIVVKRDGKEVELTITFDE